MGSIGADLPHAPGDIYPTLSAGLVRKIVDKFDLARDPFLELQLYRRARFVLIGTKIRVIVWQVGEFVAHEAERSGDLQLSPQKYAELVALAQKARRTPDELVSDISLVIARGEAKQWAVRIGIVAELPHAEWCEPVNRALLSAFNRNALERMLRLKLNVQLEHVARATGNLQDIVFDIIEWAEMQGKLGALLQAALEDNPSNIELRQIRGNFPGLFQ